jgi:tetratricopeptide (TPR) repeat protein
VVKTLVPKDALNRIALCVCLLSALPIVHGAQPITITMTADNRQPVFDWAGLNRRVAGLLRQGLTIEGQNALESGIQSARQAGASGPELAEALSDLGTLYQDSGRFLDADRAYTESAARWRQLSADPKLATALQNLASLRLLQAKPSEAENLLVEAERIVLKAYGAEASKLVPVLNGLTDVYYETGRYNEARRSSERALALLKNADEDPQLGNALFLLAKIEWRQKRETEAETLIRRAILVWQTSLGSQHPTYASGLTSLAVLLSRKNPDESERLFQESLAVMGKRLGSDHPVTGEILLLYANHLETVGRKREAKEMRHLGNAIAARHSRENLLGHTIEIRALR